MSAKLSTHNALRPFVLASCAWLTLLLVLAGSFDLRDPYRPTGTLQLVRAAGFVALCTLLASLCVTPLARLLARTGKRRFAHAALIRRTLGISAACLALLHATLSYVLFDFRGVSLAWNWPHLRFGLVALGILLVLWATSFATVVRFLGLHTWKELHRLAYAAAALSALHALSSPFAPLRSIITLLGCTALIGCGRLALPRRGLRD